MMDWVLESWVCALIIKGRWILGVGEPWEAGNPLRLLFAGYSGSRNAGSDVRVEEMIRQVRTILGDQHDLSVLSHNLELSRGYFQPARQVKLPTCFPHFSFARLVNTMGAGLRRQHVQKQVCECAYHHDDWLAGHRRCPNKLSVGYGAEAGQMDPFLQGMRRRYCADSLVITRNEESQTVLGHLGVPTELGTDTAWTFEPLSSDYGEQVLPGRVGWADSGARSLSDQSFLVAGSSFPGQAGSARYLGAPSREPLPFDLLSP
jgi:hypothetical protein